MHVHILGICGTFMAGIALIAREAGHTVTGADANAYPPMSTLLDAQGIDVIQGWSPSQLDPQPDVVVIGNALSRGNPVVEAVLDRGIAYTSGPQWLAEHVLHKQHVLAVAGTHGKTTTTSMLTGILQHAGLGPGYLIGGVAKDFERSARLGAGRFFVIEADEYDTAFFDKRSKFVHYRPRTLVLNNQDFDHADIFDDLAAIQRQFHHVIRTVPSAGRLVVNGQDQNLSDTLAMGAWTPQVLFGTADGWQAQLLADDGSAFVVSHGGQSCGTVRWEQIGQYNVDNALAAIAAAQHVGVEPGDAITALNAFGGVRRRQDIRGVVGGVTVYDDFAHHPTAIAATLQAVRNKVGRARITAILEPRSNTMKQGHHAAQLADSLALADQAYVLEPPGLQWDLAASLQASAAPCTVLSSVDAIVERATREAASGDHLLVMSNGGFGGIHGKLLDALANLAHPAT